MRIYIPTVRPPHQHMSFWQLANAGLEPILVTDERTPGASLHTGKVSIAEKRQFILAHAGKRKFCMIDDDILIKRMLSNGKIVNAAPADIRKLFLKTMPALLDKYAHGGIHPRLWAAPTVRRRYAVSVGHYRQALFYNPMLFNAPLRFEGNTGEDIWALAQLCMQGLDWFVYNGCIIEEHEPKGEPDRWTMQEKYDDVKVIAARLHPAFVGRGRGGVRIKFKHLLEYHRRKS